jgi:hypothetical protein
MLQGDTDVHEEEPGEMEFINLPQRTPGVLSRVRSPSTPSSTPFSKATAALSPTVPISFTGFTPSTPHPRENDNQREGEPEERTPVPPPEKPQAANTLGVVIFNVDDVYVYKDPETKKLNSCKITQVHNDSTVSAVTKAPTDGYYDFSGQVLSEVDVKFYDMHSHIQHVHYDSKRIKAGGLPKYGQGKYAYLSWMTDMNGINENPIIPITLSAGEWFLSDKYGDCVMIVLGFLRGPERNFYTILYMHMGTTPPQTEYTGTSDMKNICLYDFNLLVTEHATKYFRKKRQPSFSQILSDQQSQYLEKEIRSVHRRIESPQLTVPVQGLFQSLQEWESTNDRASKRRQTRLSSKGDGTGLKRIIVATQRMPRTKLNTQSTQSTTQSTRRTTEGTHRSTHVPTTVSATVPPPELTMEEILQLPLNELTIEQRQRRQAELTRRRAKRQRERKRMEKLQKQKNTLVETRTDDMSAEEEDGEFESSQPSTPPSSPPPLQPTTSRNSKRKAFVPVKHVRGRITQQKVPSREVPKPSATTSTPSQSILLERTHSSPPPSTLHTQSTPLVSTLRTQSTLPSTQSTPSVPAVVQPNPSVPQEIKLPQELLDDIAALRTQCESNHRMLLDLSHKTHVLMTSMNTLVEKVNSIITTSGETHQELLDTMRGYISVLPMIAQTIGTYATPTRVAVPPDFTSPQHQPVPVVASSSPHMERHRWSRHRHDKRSPPSSSYDSEDSRSTEEERKRKKSRHDSEPISRSRRSKEKRKRSE